MQAAAGFCRDCLADVAAKDARCPACHSPRLLRHAEIARLHIGHIDCDAFYAAVEKRDAPALRDRPVIIGGGRRGVVSTACYIARMSGVRSAMPMFQARKLCPEAVVVPPDMEKYRKASQAVRQCMLTLTPLVEPLSIDEAFLDLSGTESLHRRSPAKSLAALALMIERTVGVTVSIGLSYNKFLAKIASDLDKPRGFSIIGSAEAAAFLSERPVNAIWGIGKAMTARLARDGITRIGQLQAMERAPLVRRYGKIGERLYGLARGIDARPVKVDQPTKSISAETTFDLDIADPERLIDSLWPLCETVSQRLKKAALAGGGITLKLKTADFQTITRQARTHTPTQLAETIYQMGKNLLIDAANGTRFRLIGIGAHDLRPAAEADPLDLADPDSLRRRKIEETIDKIRAQLGPESIKKGRGLPRK